MIVGVDFDNTIVCYNGVFHTAAVARKLIPPDLPANKGSIRDYLRQQDREDDWTQLQCYTYGIGMKAAGVFPGVQEFFQACAGLGIPAFIISHRTQRPFLGPESDLHAIAMEWLDKNRFFDSAKTGLTPQRVFFETKAELKIGRIAAVGCTHFIDDLPEFLTRPDFPAGVERILFQPQGNGGDAAGLRRAAAWDEIRSMLLESRDGAA